MAPGRRHRGRPLPKRRLRQRAVEVRGGAEIKLDEFLSDVGIRLSKEGLKEIRQEITTFEGIVNQNFEGKSLFPLERRIGAYHSIIRVLGRVVGARRPHENVQELIDISKQLSTELQALEAQWQREHHTRLEER